MRRRVGIVSMAALLAALILSAAPAQAATPTVTMFSAGIPNPAVLLGITAGPDGNVWFADNFNNAVGRVTVSTGAVGEIPIGRDDPVGVAAGPDGRLYFATGLAGSALSFVGLMNPTTLANEDTWYGGGNNAMPRYPAAGPDGNIWVTETRDPSLTTGDDKIGLLDLTGNPDSGTPTGPGIRNEFNLSVGDNQEPEAIVAGPGVSGAPVPALWATLFNTGRIARIQPVGFGAGGPNGTDGAIIDEYLIPTAGSQPEGITPGPDGNIWFTEFGPDKVGRMIPPASSNQGSQPVAIDEFQLPAGSNPVGIAAGPDGNMWVGLSGPGPDGSVVRMNTSGQITGTFPTPSFQQPFMITPAADGNLWFSSFNGSAVGRINTALDPPEFQNTAQINVPSSGATGIANTYPSTVNVSGVQGSISKVTVRLTGISHTFPDDMDILLQGPQGQNVMLASDVGSPGNNLSYPANGITLTFDQDAPRSISDLDPLVSGFWKPTNRAPSESQTELSSPAPPPPYGTTLASFNSGDPNGNWRLFVIDDASHAAANTNTGAIFGGWGLDIETTTQVFVGKSGAGSGTVTSGPAGIDCGSVCTTSFPTGSTVALTANPSAGSQFAQWQDCDSVNGNVCTVNMNADLRNVTARFEPAASPPPAGPTGQRAAALAKCKKIKKKKAKRKCKRKANALPL